MNVVHPNLTKTQVTSTLEKSDILKHPFQQQQQQQTVSLKRDIFVSSLSVFILTILAALTCIS